VKVARQAGTLTTVTLARLAAEPANQNVVFIHNHPGEVKTEIFKNGWDGSDVDRAAVQVPVKSGMSPEIASASLGGKGIPLSDGVVAGLTVEKTRSGALFLVDERMECLQQGEVFAQLKGNGADEVVWEKTQEVLAPYL
jgi:hypothetical protein